MNANRRTRPAGAIATILDADVLLDSARAARPGSSIDHGPRPQMLLAVNHGELAVVNREGVGCISGDDKTVGVYFDLGGMWDVIPLPHSVIAHAATEEKVDLADGIRTFGGRLDSNHYTWFSRYDADHRP
ncbi:MAG: hypothetical protein ACTIA5_17150 [Brachybacterium tyrofermentans]